MKTREVLIIITSLLVIVFVILSIISRQTKRQTTYINVPEEKNPMEGKKVLFVEDENDEVNADGVRGHLKVVGDSDYHPGVYARYVKRVIDIILSFWGLIILSPIFAAIAFAIKIEDPGPVFFTQKRVGQNKQYFRLHKFRSMKGSTPHDMPTHMLDNPEQYITKIGGFLRKHSLDELPQVWDIFIGNLTIIGPRPALWNQDLLIAERDKYGANDVKPGLTGWAQINGRDELEISTKAAYDGEYVKKQSFQFDVKCFLGTLKKLIKDDSIVEGRSGRKAREGRDYTEGVDQKELIGHIGFGETVVVDKKAKKNVLITGSGSYIGNSFQNYVAEHYPENFLIDTLDMKEPTWKDKDFSNYDIVYHVAGIAHADVGKVSEGTKEKYYKVNTDLAIEVAKKAKQDKVKKFIFMSSMIVYGESSPYGKKKIIDKNTVPTPANFYGDSKLQADVAVRKLADNNFKVIVLRPPMVYGKGCKGNYLLLSKFAKRFPVFPDVNNERSMLYIENLCEFLCQIMLVKQKKNAIVLIPQNEKWTRTSKMVYDIAAVSGKKIWKLGILNRVVLIGSKVPGKVSRLVNKAFGNMVYAWNISKYEGIDYQKICLRESIVRTETKTGETFTTEARHAWTQKFVQNKEAKQQKKHILIISQYFYPENFRINDMASEWVARGYKVTVFTGIPNYPMGNFFEGYGYTKRRKEIWNGINIIRIPLIPRGRTSVGMIANYASFVISGFFKNLFTDIKADYVFTFEVSPMTQALIGCWYAKKHHIPHYVYVQDLWPENVITVTGIKNHLVISAIDKMVDYIYKNTDEIFATSPSFVENICNRKEKVNHNKVHYWPQYAEDFYRPVARVDLPEIPEDGSFKIAFTGNIGTAQGLDILPKVAELLKNENVKFVIVGDGRYQASLEKEIRNRNVQSRFILLPRQNAKRIPLILSACDAAFLSFTNESLWKMTIPAKLQSYMACGMPIIASAEGETRRIIEEACCGICSEIGNVKQLANAIKRLMNSDISQMGKNSRLYYEAQFDKKWLMDQMDVFFDEMD